MIHSRIRRRLPYGTCVPLHKTKFFRASLVAQTVKRLPTMRKTPVQSLGQEDLLEKQMATHSSTLAWKIPWMDEPGESDMTEQLHSLTS